MLYLKQGTGLVLALITVINAAIAQSNNCSLLVLDPPELVVRYGDPVSVSCQSLTNSDNLRWRVSQEDVLSSDKQNVTWKTENLTDWEIEPVCYMMVDGVECAKSLPVIVYKLPDQVSISVVNHIGPLIGGKKYDLQCDIQNFAPVHILAVYWYKGGELVKNRGFGNFSTKTPSNKTVTLKISVGKDEENVQYSCEAKLKLGPQSNLTVKSNLLQISVHNKPVINCSAWSPMINTSLKSYPYLSGNPSPSITWYRDEAQLNSDMRLGENDSGQYKIVASNVMGETSCTTNISVEYAPEIEPDKEVVKVKEGSKVSLNCTAKGNPEPELNWSVQSQIKATGRQQTTLTIFQVSLADAGVYTCTATNPLGDDTREVSLIVEGDPIKIQPDKLVVEFGTLALANCSITTTHHGMGWEASQGAVDMVDDVQSLTWKVESLTHWDIKPLCYFTTEEQWQLELQVTVYKRPDRVSISTVNHTGPMIEGRQYELQCDVQNVAPVRFLNVNWYKGQQLVQSDIFTDETKTPVDKTMTLQVSPQRADDGVQYRCEAELKLGPEGPQPPPRVTSDPLTITVHYKPVISCSAWSPLINTPLKSYPYNVLGNPIPSITWYRDEAQLSSDMRLGRNDSGQYTFVASNVMGNSSCTTNITVECDPIKIQPDKLVVEFGTSASANCSITTTHKGMGWDASQGAVDMVDNVQSLTWKVESLTHWDIKPLCYFTTDEQWQLELQVTVYKRPDQVSISTVNHTGPMIEGRQYELQCDVQNVAPVRLLNVNWYKGQQLVQSDSFTDETKTPVSKTMTLQVSTQRGDDGVQYRCEAELKLGPEGPQPPPTSDSLSITVHYIPVISCSAWSPMINTPLKSYPYNVLGNPIASITWYRDEAQLSSDMRLGRNDSGQYTFVASNVMGNSSCTTNITVEYTPVFECPKEYEGRENYISLADCLVMASPKASITWKKDGKIVNAVDYFTRDDSGSYVLTAVNKHGTAQHDLTVNVLYIPVITCSAWSPMINTPLKSYPYNVLGNPIPSITWYQDEAQLSSDMRLGRNDSGQYTFVASNVMGNSSCTTNITVEYGPEIHLATTEIVKEGNDVSLKCTAIGNPEPEVRWSFQNQFKTNGSGQAILKITKAVSYHAGQYTCTATNKLGSQTTTVSLEVEEHQFTKIIIILSIIIIIIIICIIIYLCIKKRRSGKYDIQPNGAITMSLLNTSI